MERQSKTIARRCNATCLYLRRYLGYARRTCVGRVHEIYIRQTQLSNNYTINRKIVKKHQRQKKRWARTKLDFHFTRNCEQLTVHNDIALNYINQSGQTRAFGESVIYVDLIHIAHWIWESLPIEWHPRIKGVDDEASIPVLSRKEKTYFFKITFQWHCYELYKMLMLYVFCWQLCVTIKYMGNNFVYRKLFWVLL